jgi:CHAT domain
VLVFAALGLWPATLACSRAECSEAFDARDWERVAMVCRDPRWGERARLAHGWLARDAHRVDEALAIAEQLVDTDVADDAAYLAGYIHYERDGASEQDLARRGFMQALRGYQRAGRHADASRAAGMLAYLAQVESQFGDELQMAQLAVVEADLSGDPAMRGRAMSSLAEAYDWIGMASAARDSFLSAEELDEPWPDELAHIYFKHAGFLLDLGDLETSLKYIDASTAARDLALARRRDSQVAQLALALRLNRADALSQLGRLDAADQEIVAATRELGPSPDAEQVARVRLVEGYVAARRRDPATAEVLFSQADDGSLSEDYRWRIKLELAHLYRAAGHADLAEDAYRAAIAIIEPLRGAATRIELRPWMLARRTLPYAELLALLVEQRRTIEALVVAESLHARAWLDAVLGGAGERTTAEQALTAARIRQRVLEASPPFDGASLMSTVGDREALVFLTVGEVTWRAHVVRGIVAFDQLPAETLALARQFNSVPDDAAVSEQTSAALLPADLADSRRPLYVIATGPLADLPFAALRRRGHYLIDERPVARLPGLVALRPPAPTWDQRAIFLGDSRGNLPEAAREVRELAASMGVSASVGPAATRQVVTSARGARILHIAAHGLSTSAGRAIALADGNLTAADVLDAGIDPQVVVLSGCATAASSDAESWDGFPSAFLAAGSRYVVATLRSVDDAPAAQVIEAYYAQPASMNPIERLAGAQRQLARTLPVTVWASFAAWGAADCDDQPCSIPPRASSSQPDAIIRAVTSAPGRGPGALPRRPGPLRHGSGRARHLGGPP